MKINFITSNAGKIKSLKSYFERMGRTDISVVASDLRLIEPKANTVAEVSLSKARQAFKILKEPVIVEDGGFAIEALNGFPGVYTKYANETIGAEGYMRLMAGIKNRNAKWLSVTTYIDSKGAEFQFNREGGDVVIAEKMSNTNNPAAWSDLWKIVWIERFQKVMADMTEEENLQRHTANKDRSSLDIFVEWFVKQK
ncbi:MAG: hypothetical protein LBF37_04140 [Rickettsiales bacterium]|jgi:XTP/dITP diphosphohydrolase|nr:hypothetical protein [Rickettsiales bacterium]